MFKLGHSCKCHGRLKILGAKSTHLRLNAVLKLDPTRTTNTARRWIREIDLRFNQIKKLIIQSVVEEDCFGLGDGVKALGGEGSGNFGHAGIPGHQGGSAPGGGGEGKWYHATHADIPELVNRDIQSIDSLGTWVSGDAELTRHLYGPRVKEALDAATGNLLEAHTDDFDKFFYSNKTLFKELFPKESIKTFDKFHLVRGPKEFNDSKVWDMRQKYLKAFRKTIEDAGYQGIVWKNSRIDTRATDVPHDVALLFHQTPIKLSPEIPKALKALASTGRKAFQFQRDPDKARSFMNWLKDQVDDKILTVTYSKTGRKVSGDSEWSKVYVDTAYRQGLRRAHEQITRAQGGYGYDDNGKRVPLPALSPVESAFLEPVHADAAAMSYTRSFQDLQNVTEAMDTQISRDLATGLLNGQGPMEIARQMVQDVDDIGIVRARMIARTETIWAYNEAALNMFESAGVEGVALDVEWSTAGYGVCEKCQELEGQVYSIEEARKSHHPPLHPNCRCALIPVVDVEGNS